MTQTPRTFRVFVSSTFEDFKAERNALQQHVFPKLVELCARHQARFQAIDLRWGVSTEAGLDQRTIQICLEEIARCQRLTPRPNFIILLGDRYGWRPLPARIEKSELDSILTKVPESDRGLLLWTEKQSKDHTGWYRLDLNADPAEYILMPREVVLAKDATDDERKAAQEAEEKRWCKIEHRLRVILLAAIDKLGCGKEDPIRFKYLASATEQEILRGTLEVLDAAEHVFGFSRTIFLKNDNPLEKPKPLAENVPPDGKAQNFLDEIQVDGGWAPDAEAHARLVALKDKLDTLLGDNLSNYKATWTGSGISLDHIGDLPDTLDKCLELLKRADLPKTLCYDAWRNLAVIILGQLKQLESMEAVKAEIDAHELFGEDRRCNFVGRKEPLQAIAKYLAASEPQPLAVIGEPGSGKSALMAKAVGQARAAHPKAVTVVRFIGATPGSSDGRLLLGNLCQQITRANGADESTVPTEYNDLAVEFGKRLELATANRPLIIFLDALDQLGKSDPARALSWLPSSLPKHVRLVVSTLPGDCEATLRSKHPEPQLVELRAMQASEGEELLGLWLETAKRKLQEPQRKEVLGKFAGCGLPLYLKLAFEEARLWHSFSEPAQTVLYEGIPALISDNLFRRLAKPASHGELFVSHALGYLAASRYGLSEDELLDVLSADEGVKADFLQRSPRSPNVDRLPVVVWSRLYFDLEPFLSEHAADGTTLLTFYHNQLREAVTTQFLAEEEDRARNAALADYFETRSAQSSPHALTELPYHLVRAGELSRLDKTLTNLEYLDQRCRFTNVYDLMSDFHFVSPLKDSWAQIANYERFIKQNAQLLNRHPDLFFPLMYHEGFPAGKAQAQALIDSGNWRKPWFKIQSVWRPEYPQIHSPSDDALELIYRVLPEGYNVWGLRAGCRLAFVTHGLGKIGMVDVESGRLLSALISTRRNRVLCLISAPENRFLAVAYEDGIGEIYQIDLNAQGEYAGCSLLNSFRFLLPAYDNPVLVFEGGYFWRQDENGELVRDSLPGVQPGLFPLGLRLPSSNAELSGLTQIGGFLIFAWRIVRDTRLSVLGPANYQQEINFAGQDATTLCRLNTDRVAIAWSNHQVAVYNLTPSISMVAETKMDDLVWGLATDGNQPAELCIMTPAHAWVWRFESGDSVSALNLANGLMPSSGSLVIEPDGSWLVANGELARLQRQFNPQVSTTGTEFRQIFTSGKGYAAVQRANEKYWFVESNRGLVMEIPLGPPLNACADYHSTAGDFLAVDPDGKAILVNVAKAAFKNIGDFPKEITSIASDSSDGYWIVDRKGNIFFLNNGEIIPKLNAPMEVEISPTLRYYAGDPAWLLWCGIITTGLIRGTTIIFFRVNRQGQEPNLERIGSRVFTPDDAFLEAQTHDSEKDEFVLKFFNSIHCGTVQDFLDKTERIYPITHHWKAVSKASQKQGVLALTTSGEICLIDPTSGFQCGFYSCNQPFNLITECNDEGEFILSSEDGHIFKCSYQEGNHE